MKELISNPLKNYSSFVESLQKKFLAFTILTAPSVSKDFLGNLQFGIMWSRSISLGCLIILVIFVTRF